MIEIEAPDIAALFGGEVSHEHRAYVTDWRIEAMGGPTTDTEERGGYEHTLAEHKGLAITPDQRHAFVTLITAQQ